MHWIPHQRSINCLPPSFFPLQWHKPCNTNLIFNSVFSNKSGKKAEELEEVRCIVVDGWYSVHGPASILPVHCNIKIWSFSIVFMKNYYCICSCTVWTVCTKLWAHRSKFYFETHIMKRQARLGLLLLRNTVFKCPLYNTMTWKDEKPLYIYRVNI